jgi:hypothetical protein
MLTEPVVDANGSPADARPRDVEEQRLIAASEELARIDRESGWNRTVAIGKLILDRFFSADPACWLSPRRHERQSLRRLAARPECPLKKSALAEAVSVYLVALQNPELVHSRVITPSHVACVLKLEDATRRKLLREAEEHEIRVRELRARVASIRAMIDPAAQRPENKSARKKLQDRLYIALSALREVRLALAEADQIAGAEIAGSALGALLGTLEAELMDTKAAYRLLLRSRTVRAA